MTFRRLLVLVVMAIPCTARPARAQDGSIPPQKAALWKEIRAVNDSMQAAFKRGDMKAVALFYADDAKMTGGGAIVTGRAALDSYWGGMGRSPGTWKLDVFEIGGSRELAYQKGRSTIILKDASGADRAPMIVEFVVIWKRDAGGGLRILYDLY